MLPKCNGTITIQQVLTWDRSQADALSVLVDSTSNMYKIRTYPQRNGLPSPQNAQSHLSFDCFLSWLCTLLGGSGPGRPVRYLGR